MIKFFRKIRQNLLNEGKTARYFKYAIGEIVLVVIGILIALQINTWNQERLSKNELELALSDIRSEFFENKRGAEEAIKKTTATFENGKKLMSLMGNEKDDFQSQNIDKLLFNTLEGQSFRPTQHSLAGVIQHGKDLAATKDLLKKTLAALEFHLSKDIDGDGKLG